MNPKYIHYIGYFAMIMDQLTNIPQIYKNYRDKDNHEISLFSLLFGTLSNIAWTIYAYQKKDVPLMISAILGIFTFIILIIQFYMYRRHSSYPTKKL